MKLLVVICMVAVTIAAPPGRQFPEKATNNVEILRYDNENDGLGNYRFAIEQSDGIKYEQAGELRNKDTEDEFIEVKGSFTWIGPDGVTYKVTYVADEDGYQPEIEQGPGGAIPGDVLKSMLAVG